MLRGGFKASLTIILHSHEHIRTGSCGQQCTNGHTEGGTKTHAFLPAFHMCQVACTTLAQRGTRGSSAIK